MPTLRQPAPTGISVPMICTTEHVAELFLVEPSTVRVWVRIGKLPGSRGHSRRVMIPGEAVVALLREYGFTAHIENGNGKASA